MNRLGRRSILFALCLVVLAPGLEAQASNKGHTGWVLGIARFEQEGGGQAKLRAAPQAQAGAKAGDYSSLESLSVNLPMLIADGLKVLPRHFASDADAQEIASLKDLRSRYAAGVELASKLDSRDACFFDPSLDDFARRQNFATADKQVEEARTKLLAFDTKPSAEVAKKAEADRKKARTEGEEASLWSGYAKGQLIDTPTASEAKTAKTADVDFLVTGSLSLRADYAVVQVFGYDARLERRVFAWKTFCAVDDPQPLGEELARRIERWAAGRDFSRIEVGLEPGFATLSVDGIQQEKLPAVVFAYDGRPIRLSAYALGYTPRSLVVEVAPGERKSVDISLDKQHLGRATIAVEPPDAFISLDSSPLGASPYTVDLDGTRGLVTARADGYESQTAVLPASGEQDISIKLLPDDGLGPTGRIDAAKDKFYVALGSFVLTIPATAVSAGLYRTYADAYSRSKGAQASIVSGLNGSELALIASIGACAVTLTFTAIRLIHYLGVAR
jgi:hypothetical protein